MSILPDNKKQAPFVDRVLAMRELARRAANIIGISDDSDMWYVEKFGYSPIEAQVERCGRDLDQAAAIGTELLSAGLAAAPAVAAGIRQQGWWREHLFPFARRYRTDPRIHIALTLVAPRVRDPLAIQAVRILEGKRLLTMAQLLDLRRRGRARSR